MPTFKLHVLMDNAAFDDAPATELARILRNAASRIEDGGILDYASLFDLNGNAVGAYCFAKED